MLELWGDSGRAQQLGQAGRRRAENHFDIRVMVARYEATLPFTMLGNF